MSRLNTVFKIGMTRVEGQSVIFSSLVMSFNIYLWIEVRQKSPSELLSDERALESHLAMQLRAGIASIDSKQPESVIGEPLP